MKPLLKLTLFGAPTVTLDEQPLTSALTGKLLALFLYLAVTAANGDPPHARTDLADLFWSELPPEQRRSNLRYLLSDLRGLVGDYLLITPQTVSFNRLAPYWLDVEVVRTTLTAATTGMAQRSDAEITAALALYQGEFLAGFRVRNAPSFMQWVATQRQELHNLIAHAPQAAPDQLLKHNLPGQLTAFFGREAEVADLLAHLSQADYRLLTIIGEGGVGKTRLVLAVAQRILAFRSFQDPKFPDGVWFVPLAEVSASADLPNQLATAIAHALDFPLQGQGTPVMQLCHYLTPKRLLLLLDNFEQLVAHADFLLTLLQKCSGVRLLVTSRQQLNLQAEYPWRLTGLPLPPPSQSATLSPDELLRYAGVMLFVERARRADPHFQLTAANQTTVVALCHWLEGLPLGIELAAALCKEYSCAELLTALQMDYALLTTNLPDLPARHRSMRDVLDHSWRLLDDGCANILATCAIFQGGFTAAAAAAVTGATLAQLHHLVDHSLLRANRDETAGWRYDLHELVRHYAREQLLQKPDRYHQVQAHHAAYYLAQLPQADAFGWPDTTRQLAVQRDFANITAAWRWSVAEARQDLLAQSAEGLARYYNVTGRLEEGLQMLQHALAVVRRPPMFAPVHEPLLVTLLRDASELCIYLTRLEEAEALVQEALAIGQANHNSAIQSWVYDRLARLAQRRQQPALMDQLAQQAYRLACENQDDRLQALSGNTLGVATLMRGDVAGARHWYHKALASLGHSHDVRLTARLHNNLGHLYKRLWDYNQATYHLTQGLLLAQRINDYHTLAINAATSGDLWLDVGVFDLAERPLMQAIQLLQKIHDPYWQIGTYTNLARLFYARGDYTAAVAECQRVLQQSAGRAPSFEHRALTYYGDAYWAGGDPAAAEQCYQRAFALQREAKLTYCLAEPAIRLAALLRQRGAYGDALALLKEPLTLIQQQGPAGSAEPFGVYLISHHVFKALADPRADLMLQQAYHLFQATIANIADATLRQAFLANHSWRRELWALVQAHIAAT